ncbi:hypothetical protein TNCV_3542961 [Trichonephila clavipes]|nr:hypothetical protein TNCV_3542961 [Trichonephila clavipes]
MYLSSGSAFFAHVNVFFHDGKPLPIELSIATIPRVGSDSEVSCITINHAGLTSTAKDIRPNKYINARLRLVQPLLKSVSVEFLLFCVRGKFSQLAQEKRDLMGVKGISQQEIFREVGLFTMSLEMLPKFKDGTFPNHIHEDVHKEGDISHCIISINKIPAAV